MRAHRTANAGPNRRSRTALLAVVVMLMTTTFVSGGTASAGTAPKRGGSLTVLLGQETLGLDTLTSSSVSPQSGPRMFAIYDALAVEDQQTGTIEMRIAKSIKSSDALTWTLKLRPNVEFSDGTPYDAAAVKFNWERLADPANRGLQAPFAQRLASMEVVDPTTLTMVLKIPDGQWPRTIASTVLTWIGSPTAIAAKGNADFNLAPVGAGPYVVEEWVKDNQLVLTRNPNYYGKTYLDELILKVIVDEAQRLNTLQTGGGNLLVSNDVNTIGKAETAGYKPVIGTSDGGHILLFNMTTAPFDDLRARQAMRFAFDAKEMNQALYNGEDQLVQGPFKPTSKFYDPKLKQPAANAKKAQKLFDELAAEGRPVSFTFLTFPTLQLKADWFAAKLASFDNVDVTIESIAQAGVTPRLIQHNYQFALFVNQYIDADGLYDVLAGPTATPPPARNLAGYDNAEVTAALETGRTSLDSAEREAAYRVVQRGILRDVPFSYIDSFLIINVPDQSVRGLEADQLYSPAGLIKWNEIWTTSN